MKGSSIGLGKKMTVAVCLKDVSIGNMGEAVLIWHKGKKQKGLLLTNMLNHWCHQSPIPAPTPALEPGNVFESSNEAAQHKATDKMLIHATTLEAEIWWVLSIVYSEYSMNLSTDSGKSFRAMFPDSDIAKSCQYVVGPNLVMWQHLGLLSITLFHLTNPLTQFFKRVRWTF